MKNGGLEVKGRFVKDFFEDLLRNQCRFKTPIEFTDWEFEAYEVYGDARCHAEGINTLTDLFGQQFSNCFYTAKNVLLARGHLAKLYAERVKIDEQIVYFEQYILNPKADTLF